MANEMKKIYLSLIFLLTVTMLRGQTHDLIAPLTPQEFSKRLIPKFKPAASMPVTFITYNLIVMARKMERATAVPKLRNADSLDVKFLNIPGLNKLDPEIPVRVYRAKNITKAPVFIWCHGGGFVAGELNVDHQRCADMTLRSGVVVVSVDYRLAPEHKFPAGVNDAYATILWTIKHAAEMDIDTTKIGVGGASAGAGIVGSLVLMARNKKDFKIKLQLLLYPPADADTNRVSMREFWNIPGVKGADLPLLIKMYTGINAGDPLPDNLLPGMTKDFKDLPATYIATCGGDPLRDGGLVYAQRLIEAGISVEVHNYPGYPHGFLPERCTAEMYTIIDQYLK